MLKWALFVYIGMKLNVGTAYYVACLIGFVASTIDFGIEMYKKGKEED